MASYKLCYKILEKEIRKMNAIWICASAKKIIEERKEVIGQVHSVFSRTCNIITEDDLLIPLISSQIPNGPRSISFNLSEERDLRSFQLVRGMKVTMNTHSIRIGRDTFTIDLSDAKVWNPEPMCCFKELNEARVLKNIEFLKDILLEKGNFNGIAPIFLDISRHLKQWDQQVEERLQTNHYCTFIYPKIQKFIALLADENIEEIGSLSKQIIGFGPGLTPSTDDFLAGLMVSMLYAWQYYKLNLSEAYKINQCIVSGNENRTTKVSAEMLQFASKGQVAEHIRTLMVSIFSEDNERELFKNTCTVIYTGGTSGSDLLAGVYVGLILTLYYRKERTKKKCI